MAPRAVLVLWSCLAEGRGAGRPVGRTDASTEEHQGRSVTPTAVSLSTGCFSKLQRLSYFTGFALTSTLSHQN